jgi:hypothetical protein
MLYCGCINSDVRGVYARNLIADNALVLINCYLYCSFILLYLYQDLFNLILLKHSLSCHIFFLKFLLFIVFFINYETLLFKMPQNKIDTIICIVRKENTQIPWLFVINLAPANSQKVRVFKATFYVVNRWKGTPTNKLPNTFHFWLRLKHQEN